jgi:hypothetical protein
VGGLCAVGRHCNWIWLRNGFSYFTIYIYIVYLYNRYIQRTGCMCTVRTDRRSSRPDNPIKLTITPREPRLITLHPPSSCQISRQPPLGSTPPPRDASPAGSLCALPFPSAPPLPYRCVPPRRQEVALPSNESSFSSPCLTSSPFL